MNDELVSAIIDLLGRPRAEVEAILDEAAAKNPIYASRIQAFKAFIGSLYDLLPGKAMNAFTEVVSLLQTGSGPVVPDIGDTA